MRAPLPAESHVSSDATGPPASILPVVFPWAPMSSPMGRVAIGESWGRRGGRGGKGGSARPRPPILSLHPPPSVSPLGSRLRRRESPGGTRDWLGHQGTGPVSRCHTRNWGRHCTRRTLRPPVALEQQMLPDSGVPPTNRSRPRELSQFCPVFRGLRANAGFKWRGPEVCRPKLPPGAASRRRGKDASVSRRRREEAQCEGRA